MHFTLKTVAASALALALAGPAAAQVSGQPYGAPAAPYPQQPAPPPGGYYYGQQPAPVYGAPPAGQPPPGAYGAPAPGYGQPPGTYGTQAPGYGGPPPGTYPAPAPGYGPPPGGAYGANTTAYTAAPVKCDNTGAIAGGLIGALGGGVLGSNVAGHGKKTEGTVLGALVGGGLGGVVGHAHDKHQCDQQGVVYYNYSDTVPYQVDASAPPDPRTTQYVNQGCRMAPAATSNGQDVRYVRVCPDPDGRYRIVS